MKEKTNLFYQIRWRISKSLVRKKEHFMEKGVADDIVEIRLKHFQNRQIDLLNRILEERRKISKLLFF